MDTELLSGLLGNEARDANKLELLIQAIVQDHVEVSSREIHWFLSNSVCAHREPTL